MATNRYQTAPIESAELSGLLPEEERGLWTPNLPMGSRSKQTTVDKRSVFCYDCGKSSQVPLRALSAQCEHCHTHLRLDDFTFTPGTLRTTMRTQGDVTVAHGVHRGTLTIRCRNLYLRGNASGDIQCTQRLSIYGSPQFDKSVKARELFVKSGAQAHLNAGIEVESAEVRGELEGNITATGLVRIRRGGILRGDCIAAELLIDKGAQHHGLFTRPSLV